MSHLRKVVEWCRERGTLLVSDECYLELTWEGEPAVSVLHPDVCGGSHEGILAVHSLSKRSNLAGYRCAFVAGDPALVGELLAVRKNLGLQMPAPQQAAMIAALGADEDSGRAARALRLPAGPAAGRPGRGRVPDRPLRGVALPVGTAPRRRRRRGLLGDRQAGWPTAGSWSLPARSTPRPAPRPARATSGSRSPPPTSGLTPRWPGWPDGPHGRRGRGLRASGPDRRHRLGRHR